MCLCVMMFFAPLQDPSFPLAFSELAFLYILTSELVLNCFFIYLFFHPAVASLLSILSVLQFFFFFFLIFSYQPLKSNPGPILTKKKKKSLQTLPPNVQH